MRRKALVLFFAILCAGMIVRYAFVSRRVLPDCPGCNVIIVSLDQVRADSIGCFGYVMDTMPNLCGFAHKSVQFTNAYAPASRTMDSHFSMITGVYPHEHGMNVPYASILSPDTVTLAEMLTEAGYRSYFMGPSGDPHLPLDRGLGRGFVRTFDADDPDSWIASMDTVASESAIPSRTFYFMHTYEAHEPYVPPDDAVRRFYSGSVQVPISTDDLCAYTFDRLMQIHPDRIGPYEGESVCDKIGAYQKKYSETKEEYDDTYAVFNDRYWSLFDGLSEKDKKEYVHALYAASLSVLDEKLGRFFSYLETRGFFENSVIVIIGDQGDEFGEHGGWSHGGTLYREVLRVPFLVYLPSVSPKADDRLASLVDIMPTVLARLRYAMPRGISGIDLFAGRHDAVISEHVSDGVWSVRTDRYTMIGSGNGSERDTQLYDRVTDPFERTPLPYDAAVSRALLRIYRLHEEAGKTSSGSPALPDWMNPDDRKRLIESGYF